MSSLEIAAKASKPWWHSSAAKSCKPKALNYHKFLVDFNVTTKLYNAIIIYLHKTKVLINFQPIESMFVYSFSALVHFYTASLSMKTRDEAEIFLVFLVFFVHV